MLIWIRLCRLIWTRLCRFEAEHSYDTENLQLVAVESESMGLEVVVKFGGAFGTACGTAAGATGVASFSWLWTPRRPSSLDWESCVRMSQRGLRLP